MFVPPISVSSTQEAVIMDRSGLGRATVPLEDLPASAAGWFLICCSARVRGDRC